MEHIVIFSAVMAGLLMLVFILGVILGVSKNAMTNMIHDELSGELIIDTTDVNGEVLSVELTRTLGDICSRDFVRFRVVNKSSQEKPRV